MTQEIVFGQWLKSRRRLYDLTQQGLADRVNCSVEMIYRIEAGQRRPSVQVARLLGAALGVPDAELNAFVGFARGAAPVRTSGTWTGLVPWQAAFIPHSTLPAQLTALIGRSKELADAAAHLRQDEVRLLTLVGPPGIGKTRLAVELGGAVLLDYPGGVHFVDIASVSEPERVVIAIARTLDIALADHKKPQDSLHTYLRERHMLLVLDNFEQILGAAPAVHALLVACPLVKLVITSREPLRIRGERRFPVEPLALPGRVDDLNADAVAGFAAVQLFVERAKAVQPDFELTPENAGAVAAVCARLDGLPLAIEIAAAQMTILQPDELLKHLTGRSLLESRGMADSDPRHQSLDVAIRWSVQSLDVDERLFFQRMGVFTGGCTLDAAQAVCQPRHDVPLLLSKLAGMNLIKREVVNSSTSRYRLLEIMRQFTRGEMQAAGEWPAIQARHADYFRAYALEHEALVRSGGQVEGLALVEREHDNLQAALDYFIAAHAWEKGLEMAGALSEFWVYRNHIQTGLHYCTALLELTDGIPALEASRARTLNGAAMLSYFAGDYRAIGGYAQAALSAAQAAGSDRAVAHACISLGMQNGGMGNFEAAAAYFHQGLDAAQRVHVPWESASLWNGLGEVARSQGHIEEALAHYAKALEISEELGNRWMIAHILDNIGHAAYSQGRYDEARDHFRGSLEASVALGDERGIAMCLEKLSGVAITQNQLEFAATLLGAAEALREARNTPVEGMDAADYRRFAEQLQQQLTADVLRTAWEAGRSLPLSVVLSRILDP